MYYIHILQDRNHMGISIVAEKAFDKVKNPFMINRLKKKVTEGIVG